MIKKFFILLFFLVYVFAVKAEIVENIVIEGNKRISDETIKIYGEVELNKNFTESDLNKVKLLGYLLPFIYKKLFHIIHKLGFILLTKKTQLITKK